MGVFTKIHDKLAPERSETSSVETPSSSEPSAQENSGPGEPPSYESLQQSHQEPEKQGSTGAAASSEASGPPQYGGDGKQDEYPQEKTGFNEPSDNPLGIPPGTYVVPPQQVNIAYGGSHTRPGYKEYVEHDDARVAQGDLPKPREAYGRKGAPLAPSHQSASGGGPPGAFPGSHGPTYYNASQK